MSNDTGDRWRRRRRAITVIGIGVATVAALATPAFAHPSFPNAGPGFANPTGGVGAGTQGPPYAPGSRPTLNLRESAHVDPNTLVNGAPNNVVDVKLLLPTTWTNPACGAASTDVSNAPGTPVAGWTCVIDNTPAGQVVHWTGSQLAAGAPVTSRARFFSFQATMPSPATQTSFGAFGGPPGVYLVETYAGGEIVDFKCPNDPRTLRSNGDTATGLVRTVAGTSSPVSPPEGPPPTVRASEGKIVFHSARDGNNEIYLMHADGSGQTRLTNHTASDTDPALSPDGTKIIFVSNRDGNNEIYSMNADGTGVTRLTNHALSDSAPAYSGHGSKIVFLRQLTASGDLSNNEIFVMNADGTGATNLTNHPQPDSAPSVSSDGRIAFIRLENGNRNVWTMHGDGSGQTRVDNHLASDGAPAWGPGGRIAFHSDRDGNQEIYTINPNGTGLVRVTNHLAADVAPTYSPDGSKIAFSTERSGNREIGITHANGSSGVLNVSNNAVSDDLANWGVHPGCGLGASIPSLFNVINCGVGHDFLLRLQDHLRRR